MNEQTPAVELTEEVKEITKLPEKVDPLKEVKSKLTDREKEDFFKCFLSDQPYTDTVPIFGGKAKVEFSTISVGQNNTVLTQQRYDMDAGIVRTNDEYTIRVIQYRLAAALKSIDGVPFCPDVDENTKIEEKNITYLVKRVAEINKWNAFKMSNITNAFNTFEQKIVALTEESFKENF